MSDYGSKLVQAIKKIEVLTRELDRANNFHESSEQECKQLKAQINRFKTGVEVISESGIDELLYEIDDETPAQSLAEVEASAIEYALRMVYHEEDDHRGYYSYEGLKLHADHIRQQALKSKS